MIHIFSEVECIETGKVRGEILFPQQIIPEIREDSELLRSGLNQTGNSGWSGIWCLRKNAVLIWPTMAHMDENGSIAYESTNGGGGYLSGDHFLRNNRKLKGDYTSIICLWNTNGNYYHWLMDGLTRLAYLPKFPTRCKILIPKHLPKFAHRSLELLGLTDRVVEVSENLLIERYWFAGPISPSGHPNPYGVKWLREKFLPVKPSSTERLIYVERNSPKRRLYNEKQVSDFFKSIGWECIDPGSLSFDDQIKIFSEAKVIVGTHGAAMTNVLWTSPGTKVVELMAQKYRNGCMAGIALICEAEHKSIVFPSDSMGGMYIPLDRLTLELFNMGLIDELPPRNNLNPRYLI